jgi:uncharacterized protein (DUF1330 family)
MKPSLTVALAVVCGTLAAPHQPAPAPAHLISNAETVTDTTMVRQYGMAVGKTIKDCDGILLVGAALPMVLDSSRAPRGRFVVIQFPSMKRLQEWYNSPAYTAIRSLRERSTTGTFFALEGVPTPGLGKVGPRTR